ncbi:MAG: P-loop NTPase fold protein [Egibacteraceae bacterium]
MVLPLAVGAGLWPPPPAAWVVLLGVIVLVPPAIALPLWVHGRRRSLGRRRSFANLPSVGVARLGSLLGLLASIALLALELSAADLGAARLGAVEMKGLLSAGALLAAVLAAPCAFAWETPLLRISVMAMTVTAAVVTVVHLPAALQAVGSAAMSPAEAPSPALIGIGTVEAPPSRAPFALLWGLRVALGVGAALLIGKLLLLHRFAACHRAKPRHDDRSEIERLLPFQRTCLTRLQSAILSLRPEDEAQVIQFTGEVGDGKSFMLDRLGRFLDHEHPSRTAVVQVDAWGQQSEPDLYLAMVEEILSHWRYWFPYGWLRYPLPMCLLRAAKDARFGVSAGGGATTKLEFPLQPPRPTWQHSLERLTARVRKLEWRTVLVLDEVDRAAPRVAQEAMTLTRRSLDLPGVVVVLSYVDEQVRFKVFNPLRVGLEDLDSTMLALIYEQWPELAEPDQLDGRLAEPPQDSDASAHCYGPPAQLNDSLRRAYAKVPPEARPSLQSRFAERYLSTRPMLIPRLESRDVAEMVWKFPQLLALVEALTDSSLEQIKNQLEEAVLQALAAWRDQPLHDYRVGSVRRMEGELFRRLSALQQPGAPLRSVGFIAAVVVTAYDAAGVRAFGRAAA